MWPFTRPKFPFIIVTDSHAQTHVIRKDSVTCLSDTGGHVLINVSGRESQICVTKDEKHSIVDLMKWLMT